MMKTCPSTYQVYFRDHDIPNTSTIAISRDNVFYFNDHFIHVYSQSTNSHSKVFPVKNSSFLTVLKDAFLCSVSGNVLTLININTAHSIHAHSSSHSEVILKEIPIQILKYNDTRNNYLGFLYTESIEIFKVREDAGRSKNMNGSSPGLLIEIQLPFKAKSMACTGDDTYILTSQNQILRCKNVFITQCITLLSKIKYIPEVTDNACKIYAFERFIFIKTDKSILKYEIAEDTLLIQYTLAIQNSSDEVVLNFFLSDTLIHLSKAPFMIMKDRIYGLDQGISEYIAVSSKRIYFLNTEVSAGQTNTYQPTYEMSDYKITVNPTTVKIPDFIRDEQQKDQFLKNSLLLKKYESILNVLQKIDMDLDVREHENEKEYELISERLELLNSKRDELEERARNIRKRAERLVFRGDLTGFYDKIRILENFLQKLSVKKFDSFKSRLKAQNTILKNKAV
ncbi:uncharacterized protein VICG_01690 [Vittaforma corneae ATCC 50505]|uniref:Uncharacterized protein n=1 Tax=Vittaforma corneae (strain ATCC 50505) TaxID=993615 RepID=L2GLZ4_VITCO|nr:uncharacterized protein VICG_01690 [Vittaforma corneae ATCC 50505]ELA41317.1 hypothetical protein VICG_01690 [Vittaforma corneae ATCC 50505]